MKIDVARFADYANASVNVGEFKWGRSCDKFSLDFSNNFILKCWCDTATRLSASDKGLNSMSSKIRVGTGYCTSPYRLYLYSWNVFALGRERINFGP